MTTAERAAEHLISNSKFSDLSLNEATEFLRGGRVRSFGVGETLLEHGEPGSTMIVVTAGEVSVQLGAVELAVLGPGETLGEMSLVDPAPRSATVVGRRSGTLIEIQRVEFTAALGRGDLAAVKALQSITATVFARLVTVNNKVCREVATPRGNVFRRLWRSLRAPQRLP